MKKAFTTLACPDLPFEDLILLAQKCGMEAVEIRLDKNDRPCGLEDAALAQARAFAEAHGVRICDLATGICVKTWDEAVLPRMERCARTAKMLGADGIRIFLGEGVKYFTDPISRDLDGVAKTLRAGADTVAKYGVALWLETHSDYSTGEVIADLLARVCDARVRVIWDAIHSIEWGESPDRTVALLGERIVHVHLKDGTRPQDSNRTAYDLCALGAGDVDFAQINNCLKGIAYNGYLSLEWEQMWHPELAACYRDTEALLAAYKSLLKRYF